MAERQEQESSITRPEISGEQPQGGVPGERVGDSGQNVGTNELITSPKGRYLFHTHIDNWNLWLYLVAKVGTFGASDMSKLMGEYSVEDPEPVSDLCRKASLSYNKLVEKDLLLQAVAFHYTQETDLRKAGLHDLYGLCRIGLLRSVQKQAAWDNPANFVDEPLFKTTPLGDEVVGMMDRLFRHAIREMGGVKELGQYRVLAAQDPLEDPVLVPVRGQGPKPRRFSLATLAIYVGDIRIPHRRQGKSPRK